MEDAWQVQEADETGLFESALPAKEQGRDDILGDKEAVWRVPDVGVGQENRDRERVFRCIAYNIHRVTNLFFCCVWVTVSSELWTGVIA